MRAALLLLTCTVLHAPALAHGGAYTGPSDQSASAGGTSGAGGSGSGPLVSSPLGAGAGAGPTASAPTSRTSRGGSGRRSGAATVASSAVAYDGWEFWWEANRDAFVDLKSRLGQGTHVAGSPGFLTARGGKAGLVSEPRPSRHWVDGVVVPALLGLSTSTEDRDILDSALIALGRSTSPADRPAAREACLRLLGHHELSVQGAAVLGLGILGDAHGESLLEHLLLDDSDGRQALGGGSVPWLVRSFAALGLGLLGTDGCVDALLGAVERLPDSERDVKVCAIAALGVLPDPAAHARRVAAALLPLLDGDVDAVIASYVPTTLGKLGAREALPVLTALVRSDDTPLAVRQSAVIGLGNLASLRDAPVVAALHEQIDEGRDQLCRHFALMSLARLGMRDDRATGVTDEHERLERVLRREVAGAGHSRAHRSWAALAMAIYGRAHSGAARALLPELRAAFEDEHDPSFRGAFALAMALLDDRESASAILDSLERSHQDDYRGYASEALGLLRHRAAAPALRELCTDEAIPEMFRIKSAMGLGLMGDREAVPLLVDGMTRARSLAGLSAMARSLGLIGDQDAAEPLLELAADDGERELTRAFATVALGLLGERDSLPFNVALRADNNYLHQTPAMAEVLRIL